MGYASVDYGQDMSKSLYLRNTFANNVEYSESNLIDLIREGNERAFDQAFILHFKKLHAYARTFVRDGEIAEELVQNVFCRVWEKRTQLNADGYLRSYLYRAVHNECLNHLKHQKVRESFSVHYSKQMEHNEADLSNEIHAGELQKQVHRAVNELPEQCRAIFQMSRFEQLKYHQIAEQLNISVKTVENQMGKALKILRVKLADFLPLLFIYLFYSL